MADSLVRLRQLNSGEIGKWVLTLVTGLTGNSTIVSQVVSGALPVVSNSYNIPSGSGNPFVAFPANFTRIPNVFGAISNNSGDGILGFQISGASISGFYLNFSDTVSTDNYYFTYLATTGTGLLNFGIGGSGFTMGHTGDFVTNTVLANNTNNIFNAIGNSYYPLNNPSGFITGLSTGSFITIGQTGSFVTTGQTGSFASNTGSLTGIFYPRSNPSGFITTGQTGSFGGSANTGLLTGAFYPLRINPSGYIGSGQLLLSSGHLQNQIEDLRFTGAFVTTGAGDIRYARLGNTVVSNDNFALYDVPAGKIGFLFESDDEYYLRSPLNDAYIDINGATLSPDNFTPTIHGFLVTGGEVHASNKLTLNGKTVLTIVDSGNLLGRASGDALYYSVSNPDNYASKSYVGANFAPLATAALLGSPGIDQNTSFYLADSINEILPLVYVENSAFYLNDSKGNIALDIYGNNYTGNSALNVKKIIGSTGNIAELYADSIYLGGIPIKQAISGAAVTGSLVSMTDDYHNVRATFYDTGSSTNRFKLGSGRNDEFYLQYYYVYPNTSTELKSKIDFANQNIQGFNIDAEAITADNIKIGGLSVLTTADTGNFLDGTGYSLRDQNSKTSVGWASGVRTLYDDSEIRSVEWGNRELYDNISAEISADWNQRQLFQMGESPSLDWQTLRLSGNWEAGGLKISGFSVVTTNQTGINLNNFAKLGVSGFDNNRIILWDEAAENYGFYFDGSSNYYLQNPSFQTTKIDFIKKTIENFSGDFAALKVSGVSVSTGNFNVNTGQLTGEFYPLKSNPSGYITGLNTGNFITSSQTGTFQSIVTGTSNYLAKFNSNGTGLIKSNIIVDSNGTIKCSASDAELIWLSLGSNNTTGVFDITRGADGNYIRGGFGDLVLSTSAGGAATTSEKLRIKAAGNVGINNSTPVYSLDVSGGGNFSSGLAVKGFGDAISITGGNISINQTGSFTGISLPAIKIKYPDSAAFTIGLQGNSWQTLGFWQAGVSLVNNPAFGIGSQAVLLGQPIQEYAQSIRLYGRGDAAPAGVQIKNNNASSTVHSLSVDLTDGQSSHLTVWRGSGSNVLSCVNSSGYFGVNSASPRYSLDVSGSGNFSSGLLVGGHLTTSTGATFGSTITAPQLTLTTAGDIRNQFNNLYLNGTYGLDLNSPSTTITSSLNNNGDVFRINNALGVWSGNLINALSAGVKRFSVSSDGSGYFANNVGIKNLTPRYSLDVSGSGNFSSGLFTNSLTVTGDSYNAGDIAFNTDSSARSIKAGAGFIKFGQSATSNRFLRFSGFSDGIIFDQDINFSNNSFIGRGAANGIIFQSSSGPNDNGSILLKTSQGNDPANPVVRVWDNSDYNQHRLFGVGLGGSTYSEIFTIKGTSGVGINNTSPTYNLDVNGSGRFTSNLVVGGSGSFSSGLFTNSLTVTGDSYNAGDIAFNTDSSARSIKAGAGFIKFGQSATSNRFLRFSGFSDGIIFDQDINFSNNSFIGRGAANGIIFQSSSGPNDNGSILLKTSQGNDPANPVVRVWDNSDYNQHRLFGVGLGGSTYSEIFTIKGTSGVGINNTSPTYNLDVNGSGRFTSNLVVGGSGSFSSGLYVNGNSVLTGFNSGLYVLSSQTGAFVTTGQTGNFVEAITLTRNIPTTVNDIVEIGSFLITNGAHNISVFITNSDGSYSVSKAYIFTPQYNNPSTWVELVPIADSGPYSSNNHALDINSAAQTLSLRLRRTQGSTSGTANIKIFNNGFSTTAFTATSGTASVAAPSILSLDGLSSVYYPRSTNPSGYVRSSETGTFVTTSQTGQFYAASNPNSYATSGYVQNTSGSIDTRINAITSWTGTTPTIYYPRSSNPSGYITGFNSGNFVTSNQTGSFITTGQTGQFASSLNLNATGGNLQGQINTISFWTGYSTGLYYPRYSNPSGYITGINTGNFVLSSQTGTFITSSQTGQFERSGNLVATGSNLQSQINVLGAWTGSTTGLYYPRFSNPSGYITGLNTGSFITTSQTGDFINKTSYVLKDQNNKTSVDWALGTRLLYDDSQKVSLGWNSRELYDDISTELSVHWGQRKLFQLGESPSLDWQNLRLSGNWEAGGLKVSGFSVVTTNQTGTDLSNYAKLGTSVFSNNNFVLYDSAAENTGLFFGDGAGGFHLQDPSNSATKIDFLNKTINNFSGNFTTLKVSGINVSTGASSTNTGELTGAFYPRNSNPSGYIVAGQTGAFLGKNGGNFSGQYYFGINNGPSSIIQFYSGARLDFGEYTSIEFNQNTWITDQSQEEFWNFNVNTDLGKDEETVLRCGDFYTSQFQYVNDAKNFIGIKPNAIIDGLRLSSHLSVTGSGNFTQGIYVSGVSAVLTSQTGGLTGAFYPLRSNPSGYITGLNTGGFITSSQTGTFQSIITGFSGYVPKFNNNSTGLSKSNIFISGTTVGINTAAPSSLYSLDVNGSGKISAGALQFGTVRLTNTNTDFIIGSDIDGGANFRLLPYNGDIYFDNTNLNGKTFFRNSNPSTARTNVTIKPNGYVGIGIDPNYTLDVIGSGNFLSGLCVNGVAVVLASQTGGFGGTGQTGNFLTMGQADLKYASLTGNQSFSGINNFTNEIYVENFFSANAYTTTLEVGTTYTHDLEVSGSGNFRGGLYINGKSVLTGFNSGTYALLGSSVESNNNFILYDPPNNQNGFVFIGDDQYYLRSAYNGAYIDINAATFAPVPTIYGFAVSGGPVGAAGEMTLDGHRVLTALDSGSLFSEQPTLYKSPLINFKATGTHNITTISGGRLFLLDTMEVISLSVSGASTAPCVCFGHTSNISGYQSPTLSVSNSIYARHIFDNPQDAITSGTTICASIISGSSGTIHSGFFVLKGYSVRVS